MGGTVECRDLYGVALTTFKGFHGLKESLKDDLRIFIGDIREKLFPDNGSVSEKGDQYWWECILTVAEGLRPYDYCSPECLLSGLHQNRSQILKKEAAVVSKHLKMNEEITSAFMQDMENAFRGDVAKGQTLSDNSKVEQFGAAFAEKPRQEGVTETLMQKGESTGKNQSQQEYIKVVAADWQTQESGQNEGNSAWKCTKKNTEGLNPPAKSRRIKCNFPHLQCKNTKTGCRPNYDEKEEQGWAEAARFLETLKKREFKAKKTPTEQQPNYRKEIDLDDL